MTTAAITEIRADDLAAPRAREFARRAESYWTPDLTPLPRTIDRYGGR